MPKVTDEKHRNLLNKYIKHTESLMIYGSEKNTSIEVEYPYNYYGDRGFIDVLVIRNLGDILNSIRICEVKPDLDNLGEAIRQLRKAKNALLKIGIPRIYINDFKIFLDLVTILNEKNYNILKTSYNILSHLPERFGVMFLYGEETIEFDIVFSDWFSSEFIEKHGDHLDQIWKTRGVSK